MSALAYFDCGQRPTDLIDAVHPTEDLRQSGIFFVDNGWHYTKILFFEYGYITVELFVGQEDQQRRAFHIIKSSIFNKPFFNYKNRQGLCILFLLLVDKRFFSYATYQSKAKFCHRNQRRVRHKELVFISFHTWTSWVVDRWRLPTLKQR